MIALLALAEIIDLMNEFATHHPQLPAYYRCSPLTYTHLLLRCNYRGDQPFSSFAFNGTEIRREEGIPDGEFWLPDGSKLGA